jgi:hypothetical protein
VLLAGVRQSFNQLIKERLAFMTRFHAPRSSPPMKADVVPLQKKSPDSVGWNACRSFEVNDGALVAFAGLWDKWASPPGESIESCTILTTTPSFPPGRHSQPTASVSEMLSPFNAGVMRRYPVSTRVIHLLNRESTMY